MNTDRIKELRKKKKLSQEEMGRLLGLKQTTYAAYEIGKTKFTADIIIEICKLFNVSSDYILGLKDDEYITKEKEQ